MYLSTLLFDTYSFSEGYLRVENLLQCGRNHRIKHIEVREISSPYNRSWCLKFVNWFCDLNFFDPEHCDLRICCFRQTSALKLTLPALKFHRVRKFSENAFRNRNSRIIHHTIVRSCMVYSTSASEVRWLIGVFNDSLFTFSLTVSGSFRSQFLRGRCQILSIVEDCRG